MLQRKMPGKQLGKRHKIRCELEKNNYDNRKKHNVHTRVSILIHKAPNKNWRKILILLEVINNPQNTRSR